MSTHYVLKVYAVETMDSNGRDNDIVTVEVQGALTPKTKKAITAAAQHGFVFVREKKNVLA